MDKENVNMCIYAIRYYSAIKKKKEISPFAITWMDLEGIC